MEERQEDIQGDGVCCEDFWELLIGNWDDLIDNTIDNVMGVVCIGLSLYGIVRDFFIN